MVEIFVGRQPILDIHERIYGYELLYRNSEKNIFPDVDPDEATIDLIVNAFHTIGEDRISEQGRSFINFTGNLLIRDIFDGLNPENVVIEILEGVEITPSLITRLRSLKAAGFQIAMDDFIIQEQYERNIDLFGLVTYIKIDFFNTTLEERLKIEQFSKQYKHIQLIAEKVETLEDYKYAKKTGYTLFQGYYFAKPEIISGFEIPPKVNLQFQIIEQLNVEEPNIHQIAELIKHDISLSYKLLRFMNSTGVGIPRKITSINQAIIIVGLTEMKKWMHVLALRDMAGDDINGRTVVLIEFSLTRAKMCELLAKNAGKQNTDEYFLAGMFSLMDVIMSRSWSDLLPLLPLSENVKSSLVGNNSEMIPYLKIAEAVERFDWEQIDSNIEAVNSSYSQLRLYSQEVNRWSRSLD